MKESIADKLVDTLNEKISDYECPICHYKQLQIAEGIFLHISHEKDVNLRNMGPYYVPTLPVVCPQCGFISQHVLSVLVEDWEQFIKDFTSDESQA